MENSIKEIIMKIEIDLPEDIYYFYKSRASYHNKELEQEIIDFLNMEANKLKKLPFEDVMIL